MLQQRSLAGREIHKIVTLSRRCAEADGVEPFNEHTMLSLAKPQSDNRSHLFSSEGDDITAYAQIELAEGIAAGELAVDPDHRRRGLGTLLVRAVLSDVRASGAVDLRLWAHGDLPAAAALAEAEGFSRDRVLFKLARRFDDYPWPASWPGGADPEWPVGPGPALVLPEGIALSRFLPGRDEQALLDVNAAAFADHPEQGRWTLGDLEARQGEPWFDPEGVIVAADEEGMLGFHWTKTVEGTGEVYVLAVHPRAQGLGLGKVLSAAGLAHLASRGVDEVELYVDESNRRAVDLYRSQGFATARTDVQWRRALG
jgi:mycothiol synthase